MPARRRALATVALLGAACLAFGTSPVRAENGRVDLAPHKAIYPLTLKKVDTASKIVAATGAIYYEMADGCRDWRTRYILILRLTRENRTEVETRTEFESTESKSGRSFSFESKTLTNGRLSASREGKATLAGPGQGGTAVYRLPNQTTVPLPAGVLLPNRHSIEMIRKARAGETIFWAQIFDGSDDGKASGVNTLILGKAAPNRRASPLFATPGWRFRLSYFDLKRGEQKPTYKMLSIIRDNGVTETVELDYDDFVLEGHAKHIEPLPRPTC